MPPPDRPPGPWRIACVSVSDMLSTALTTEELYLELILAPSRLDAALYLRWRDEVWESPSVSSKGWVIVDCSGNPNDHLDQWATYPPDAVGLWLPDHLSAQEIQGHAKLRTYANARGIPCWEWSYPPSRPALQQAAESVRQLPHWRAAHGLAAQLGQALETPAHPHPEARKVRL